MLLHTPNTGNQEFLCWNGSWAGSGVPQQLLREVEEGAEAVPAHLVPGGVPVVVILPVGQHPLLNLLVPALSSHLGAKILLSGLQPPPVTPAATPCHPLPSQVSAVTPRCGTASPMRELLSAEHFVLKNPKGGGGGGGGKKIPKSGGEIISVHLALIC